MRAQPTTCGRDRGAPLAATLLACVAAVAVVVFGQQGS